MREEAKPRGDVNHVQVRQLRRIQLLLAVALAVWGPAAAIAQPAAGGTPAPQEVAPDPAQAELTRARVLLRLGRMQEALDAFRALVARSGDRGLREEYAETLADSGLLDEAAVYPAALSADCRDEYFY